MRKATIKVITKEGKIHKLEKEGKFNDSEENIKRGIKIDIHRIFKGIELESISIHLS